MLAVAAAKSAGRSWTEAERSVRARCSSALAEVKPATSARDFAKSSRAMSQHAAKEAATRQAATSPVAQGQTTWLALTGAAVGSGEGAGMELRNSLTIREATLS